MSAKKMAVMDISGDVITLVVQDNKYVDNFLFKRSVGYDGYMDGEFLDVSALFKTVDGLIKDCQNDIFSTLTDVWVGVPGEFTTVVVKNVQKSLGGMRKVTQRDADLLLEENDAFKDNPNFVAINASPIYYAGDDGKRTIGPVGITTTTLTACVSYILCERSFYDLFNKMAEKIGVTFEYSSSVLAEVMFVVPDSDRDNGIILADIGYITSTVAYAKGDGILHSVAFSAGSGHIAGDLITCMEDMPYSHAKEIVKKLNLNINPSDDDEYSVSVDGETFNYPIKEVNEISICRVQDIATRVTEAIARSRVPVRPDAPILLTGSGLATVTGAKEILENTTGRAVRIIASDIPEFNKPKYSSIAGLIRVQQKKMTYSRNKLANGLRALFGKMRRTK